jgi:hypothetical protein
MGALRRTLAASLCMFSAGAFAAPPQNLCEKGLFAFFGGRRRGVIRVFAVVRHRRDGRVEKRRGDLGFVSKPTLRFLFPLIECNVRIFRITLSGWLHVRPTAHMIGASVRDG